MKKCSSPLAYERFSSLMLDRRLYLDPLVSFRTVCALMSVNPDCLDRLLRRELGTGGEELMESFRRSDVESLFLLP